MKLQTLLAVLCGITVAAHAEVCSNITNEVVTVDARNDEWSTAALKVKPGDLIMVLAGGKVTLPHSILPHEVSAKGAPNGVGGLEMKVGTGTVIPVGERWVGAFREAGTIKFRVTADRRSDVAGGYSVRVVLIPAGTLPPTVKVDAD